MARKKGAGSVYFHPKRREYVGQFFLQTAQGSKRKTVYAKTEAAAWAKMEEARNLTADDIWEAENPYLEDWLYSWLEQTKNRVRIRTFERYEQNVRVHLVPALGDIRTKDLKRSQVQALYDAKTKQLSPRTVNYIHVTFHAALDAAVLAGKAQRNVSAGSLPFRSSAGPYRASGRPIRRCCSWTPPVLIASIRCTSWPLLPACGRANCWGCIGRKLIYKGGGSP